MPEPDESTPATVAKKQPAAKRSRATTPPATASADPAEQETVDSAVKKRPVPLLPLVGVGALVVGLLAGGLAMGLPANSAEAKLKATLSDVQGKNADLKSQNQTLQDAADTVTAEQTQLDADKTTVASEKATVDAALAAVKATTFEGDGTYIVGRDVQTGLYRSAGGDSCYWELKNAAGNILDNYIGAGPAVVRIPRNALTIEVSGCEPYTKVG